MGQQPAAQAYDQAYPTGVNPDLDKEIKKQKKKEKKENEKNPLNAIGALRDDPDRQRFVVKVYFILAVQMIFTVASTAFVMSSEPAKEWIRENYWTHYVALALGCLLYTSPSPRD